MISRPWVVAVAAVAAALVLVWLAQRRSDSVTPEPVAAATVAPPEQIVATTNVSRPVEPALASLVPALASGLATAEPPVTSAPLPGDVAMPERGEAPNQAERDRRFRAEPVDTEWAPAAEQELLRNLAEAPGLSVITMRAECRATLCRLEITLPAGTPDDRAVPVGRTFDLRPTLIVALRDPSGAPSTVMYFVRPGYEPTLLRRDSAAQIVLPPERQGPPR
jgi:hypothetical protein